MRAIEYGQQQYGGYSLQDTETNIFVFNDEINVVKEGEINPNIPQDDYVFMEIEIENQLALKKEGLIMSQTEFDYIKDSGIIDIEKVISNIQFSYHENVVLTDVYQINHHYFIQLPIDITGIILNGEEQILYANTKTKPAKPTLNTILKDKKMTVVLFISTDGAQLERAYQSIDSLYENEIVLFIEKNEGVNIFGSVVRVKTGSNINSLGMFPYKDLSKIVKIYNTDIGSASFEEILKEHLEDKTEKIYLVKEVFGFYDKVTSFGTNLGLKAIKEAAEKLSLAMDELKIDEKKWKYYNKDGTVVENPDLLLPGLSLIKQANAQQKKELNSSKLNALAIAHIEKLESTLKNQLIHNNEVESNGNFTKEKAFKKIIKLVLNVLQEAKYFFKNPLRKEFELAEDVFVIYNAFIVGLLNGLTEAIKGLLDLIALICKGILELKETQNKIAGGDFSYMSLFFEMLENLLETFTNLFSKKNLEAIFEFVNACMFFGLSFPKLFLNWLTQDGKTITSDAIGYYLGYIIGMIVEMVLEALLFGAGTVAKAVNEVWRSFADLFVNFSKAINYIAKKSTTSIDKIMAIFAFIRQKSKNIKPLLDDFLTFLKSVFARAQDFLTTFPKAVRETYQKFGVEIREVPKSPVLFTGIPVKVSDDVYVLIKEGKEIFRGTKEEVEAIAKKLKGMSDDVAEKYLDDLEEAIKIIRKGELPKATNQRLKIFANEFLESIPRMKDRKGAVCAIQYKGEVFYGRSFKGLERGVFPDLHPLLDAWVRKRWKEMELGKVTRLWQHGKCAEVDALNQLLYSLENQFGKLNLDKVKNLLDKNAISKALDVSKNIKLHGEFKEACKSCNPMLEYFNIIEDLTELKI